MSRKEPWKALAESNDAVDAAVAQLELEDTPQARAAVDETARVYQLRLARVIGLSIVQRWANRRRAHREAIDRTARLNATMSTKATKDAADVKFLMDVAEEQIAAAEAYKNASAEVIAAVERARADGENEEKS